MGRSYARRTGLRSPALVVVAAEGAVTERRYFKSLESKIHDSRVKFKYLDRDDSGHSCPVKIVEQLSEFKKKNSTSAKDSYCAVVDTDGPHGWKIADAAKLCNDKEFLLAASNPCFEVWLLFHLVNCRALEEHEITEIEQGGKGPCVRRIETALGPNNDSILNFDYYDTKVVDAISQARYHDRDNAELWPKKLGTRVYLLLEMLMADRL